MNFKILLGDKGNVDFDNPVEMTSKEKEEFIQLLRSLFAPSVIQEETVKEFRNWRMGGDRVQYPRVWTAGEYEVLLKSFSLDEAIDKLGRSGMAIIVQDGVWRPDFFSWCHKRGKNPFEGDTVGIIKEFMKEKKDKILAKRKKQKEVKEKQKEIVHLKEELESWESEKKKRQTEFLMNIGRIPKEDITIFLEKKKKEVLNKIKRLGGELK